MNTIVNTLLLLDTRMTGHRPSYLRRIAHMALARDMQVIIAMPAECFSHPVVVSLFEKSPTEKLQAIRCKTVESEGAADDPKGMLRRQFQCMKFYRDALATAQRRYKIDRAVINMFDDAAILSGLFTFCLGDIPWDGIVMRQKFHLTTMGIIGPPETVSLTLKRRLFIRLLKKLSNKSRILTIDESLKDYIHANYPTLTHTIDYIPDPVEERGLATNPNLRKQLGIAEDVILILAYGTLRQTKGVDILLDALHELPQNFQALLVGSQADDITARINEERHRPLIEARRIHQVNRYIDVSEDPNFFQPADIVWIGYKHSYHAMSAVMVQAAQYQRPTIATKNGLVGKLTRKYRTGIPVDTTKVRDVVEGILKLSNKEFTVSAEEYVAFANAYSLKAFEKVLFESVDTTIS